VGPTPSANQMAVNDGSIDDNSAFSPRNILTDPLTHDTNQNMNPTIRNHTWFFSKSSPNSSVLKLNPFYKNKVERRPHFKSQRPSSGEEIVCLTNDNILLDGHIRANANPGTKMLTSILSVDSDQFKACSYFHERNHLVMSRRVVLRLYDELCHGFIRLSP
jgi:hypothetical protein